MAKKKDKEKNYRPTIKNRKAKFEYHFEQTYVAGIVLTGTEIKSIRNSKIQLAEAYCYFKGHELWIKDLHISPYSHGNQFNAEPRRERKLLLKKKELQKLKATMEKGGLTVIPYKLFFNPRNIAKLEIALAKGKKLYDKRQDLKEKDSKKAIAKEMNL
ncbi:UNVERIFIED_CONTAM: hypothetical protein GTU68_029116 [Idotea baltica]|nr:hypothetical protein [Idotea baltica]